LARFECARSRHGVSVFLNYRAQFEPVLDRVVAVYLMDEPYLHSNERDAANPLHWWEIKANLETVNAYVHQQLPGVATTVAITRYVEKLGSRGTTPFLRSSRRWLRLAGR
jgi:hypothetical protein